MSHCIQYHWKKLIWCLDPRKGKRRLGFIQPSLTWQINQPSTNRSCQVFVFPCYNKSSPTQAQSEFLFVSSQGWRYTAFSGTPRREATTFQLFLRTSDSSTAIGLQQDRPCPGPWTTEGPDLTLFLSTPSMGVKSAVPRGHAHLVLPHALAIQDPRMPCINSPSSTSSVAQVLCRVHIPKDSECPRSGVCMGVMDRTGIWHQGGHTGAHKATCGKGWTQHWEEKGNRPQASG